MTKAWIVLLSGAALLAAGCAPMDPEVGDDDFGVWDLDDDGYLGDDEFETAWDSKFAARDVDDSGYLEQDEWDVGLQANGTDYGAYDYRAWDVDDDGLVDPDEFATGAFETLDADADRRVGRDEWDQGIGVW